MEATRKRNIKSGYEYDRFFSRAPGNMFTVKKNATLTDTVDLIPKVVQQTTSQTAQLAQVLKGKTIYETCKNIWHFVYGHIQYKKDATGYEQIRSPRRTWHDRKTGVDCDCYSVFISGILANLGIPHILRITKYSKEYFQHIYPVVPYNGRFITLDCVTDRFDYEVPFSEKKDYPMELQFLDGIPAGGIDELGKIIKRNMAKNKKSLPAFKAGSSLLKKIKAKKIIQSSTTVPGSAPVSPPQPKKKKKGFFKKLNLKKVLNVVNKVNPATVLLRNGLLLAMKMNVANVARRIRWGFLTPEQAAAKNIDPAKFQKLLATRQKLEKIFYGAGGKISNLKKAILTGKANKDKAVPLSGLEGLGAVDFGALDYMNWNTPIQELLGPDIYYSENIEGLDRDVLDGLGELGEPITLATVGAAMGVIKGVIASLKQIGNIFKGKGEGGEDFDEAVNEAAENNQPVKDTTPVPPTATTPVVESNSPATTADNSYAEQIVTTQNNSAVVKTSENSLPADNRDSITDEADDMVSTSAKTEEPVRETKTDGNTNNTGGGDDKQGFWDKNKKWLKPTLIVGGSAAVIAIGYSMYKSAKARNKSSPGSLAGPPGKKKNHQSKTKPEKKKAVALV